MNGYLISVFVKFTANEAGKPPSESERVSQFPIKLVATREEILKLTADSQVLFKEVQDQYGFPFGELSHVWVTSFVNDRIVAGWQPEYFRRRFE